MTNIVTDELHQALVDAEAALAERAKFEALARTVAAERVQSEARAAEARSEVDALEAEVMLGGPPAQLKTLRAQAAEADAIVARLDAAQRILPAKLVAADARLTEAAAALTAAETPVHAVALQSFVDELKRAVDVLATVLLRGYALNAGGVHLAHYLAELAIPSPLRGEAALLQAGILNTREPVNLSVSWRENEEAATLYEQIEPLHRAKARLKPHLTRIEREATRMHNVMNTEARLNSRQPPPPPPATDWTPPPNPHPFVPASYSSLPQRSEEASIVHARLGTFPEQR